MKHLFLVFLLISMSGLAQDRDHFNLELRSAIPSLDPDEEINLFIRGDLGQISQYVRQNNGLVKAKTKDVLSVRLPVSSLQDLRSAEFVDFIEFSLSKPQVLSDVMLVNNNVHPVHQGVEPLPQAYLGDDVIIGIIDTGLELDHPDFQNEDGTTRVVALWDHIQDESDPFRVPEPYGYGQEWSAEDIDADIDGHEDPASYSGHGSTVGGVAAGNGNATEQFKGVAPNADIIVVASDFSSPNWKSTIADAVDYIFKKADDIGKPAVINASLGDYYGSHDAKDGAALIIEDLLEEQAGRSMVAAAGNSNNFAPYHLSYEIPETDTAFTWFSYNTNSVLGEPAVFFELWADSADFYDTRYSIGADLTTPGYEFMGYANWRSVEENLGVSIIDTLFLNDDILGIVETWCGQRGDQYQLQIAVTEAFSNQYKWRFSTTGGGTFDVWSYGPFGTSVIESENLPGPGVFPDMTNYRLPDKQKTIVDSWTCSDKVLTVANYVNRNEYPNVIGETTFLEGFDPQDISVNSSSGPTRDGRQKPDITATGDIILSAGRLETLDFLISNEPARVAEGGWHYRNGGTSMSSPAVAGVAALYFQRDPEANYEDVKTAIEENALADEYTGVLPNYRWGFGKLDAFATLTEPFGITSTSFVNREGGLITYPNPSSGTLFVKLEGENIASISIFDLAGRQVKAINTANQDDSPRLFDVSDLSDGLYVLQVLTVDQKRAQTKIMVEN